MPAFLSTPWKIWSHKLWLKLAMMAWAHCKSFRRDLLPNWKSFAFTWQTKSLSSLTSRCDEQKLIFQWKCMRGILRWIEQAIYGKDEKKNLPSFPSSLIFCTWIFASGKTKKRKWHTASSHVGRRIKRWGESSKERELFYANRKSNGALCRLK